LPKKLYLIAFIAIVTLIAASLLSIISYYTPQPSADQETIELLQHVFPEASFYQYYEETRIYTVYAGKREAGFAYIVKGAGFSDVITILVGLLDKETISGIYVVSHADHLGGIGEAAGPTLNFSPWDEQFKGLKIADCYLTTSNGKVDAITGATVSSRKVTDIVRTSALNRIGNIS
jgi:Na+-translocating ferredoxin:NAD+ oxidoreductase RnfG subunit